MAALHELTALETAAAVRCREISPVELIRHALDRIERLDPELGAFVTLTADRALNQARAAESAVLAADDPASLPPLLGVPTAIKDLNMVSGVPTKLGSLAFADFVPDWDDNVVALLRAAGTISVGKTKRFTPYTAIYNTTGQPAISLPLYQSSEGLPIGMMFVGRPREETTLLALAAQLEEALPWAGRRPPIWDR